MPYLSPQQGSEAQDSAPEPLVDGEAHTAERLPSKLHDDDLRETEAAGKEPTASYYGATAALLKCELKTASPRHLDDEGAEDNAAEDGVVEDAFKDVALAVDLAGVDLVEQLHQHEGVEDDGVVLGGRRVERGVPAAVDVKQFLSCERRGRRW